MITGPSGSGKTTLLLVMAGLQDPDRGQVLPDGEPLSARDDGRRRFGVVQNHGRVSVLTAAENVAIALPARDQGRAEVAERTRDTSPPSGSATTPIAWFAICPEVSGSGSRGAGMGRCTRGPARRRANPRT